MLRNIFCWKGFGPVTGPPSFPGANFQQMVIARLSLGLSFLGLQNFLKLCHDEKPCTWWLGEKGLGSLQSRPARMLHHEYDALKGYRFLGGAISFYSVSCMSDVIFNPSLLNWSSLILTVAHIFTCTFHLHPARSHCGSPTIGTMETAKVSQQKRLWRVKPQTWTAALHAWNALIDRPKSCCIFQERTWVVFFGPCKVTWTQHDEPFHQSWFFSILYGAFCHLAFCHDLARLKG